MSDPALYRINRERLEELPGDYDVELGHLRGAGVLQRVEPDYAKALQLARDLGYHISAAAMRFCVNAALGVDDE